ncbi:MAG: phosphate signaling complex protein PhoU [Anaerolineaceae bacterium]|nr:MAG: phosphate signaling complex protein PhoU [Anaerolineaceae bacterium]
MTEQESSVTVRAILDRDLAILKEDTLRMGGLLESAIDQSMQALRNRDAALAQEIVANDAEINALRFKVEEASLHLIATQQPAAGDLRAVVAALNMVTDLERMGDHAAGIAKIVLRLPEDGSLELPPSLEQMVNLALNMLSKAMEAYLKLDDNIAYSVATLDDMIDLHYKALFRELVDMMSEGKDMTNLGIYLMFVGHNLERIADRVTNLAERVIFMRSGLMQELNPEPDEADIN